MKASEGPAQPQNVPGPMVAIMISGDEKVIQFSAKTLISLNDQMSVGLPVVLTA